MKVLVFVDLHGWFDVLDKLKKKAESEKVDLVICCGDFTTFGRDMKLILKRINEFSAPVILLHGNHEDGPSVEKEVEIYDNITYLHMASIVKDNYFFFGYGGDGFSSRDQVFTRVTKKMIKDIKKDQKFILLLHGPPHGNKLDVVMDRHVGNKDYSDFIKKSKPKYVFFGHLHENANKRDKIGESIIINPGPEGQILDI